MQWPCLNYESSFGEVVAGIDEAGRGPWAGPVVAAAVIFNKNEIPGGINDSKKLSGPKREILYQSIMATATVGVGIATHEEIDHLNILQASLLAMQRAFAAMNAMPHIVLVDGNKCPVLPCLSQAIIGGDKRCPSIAAASIIAKVTRDRAMADLAMEYPQYGWETNAGYGTPEHQKALAEFGVTPYHRRSYKPIQAVLQAAQERA